MKENHCLETNKTDPDLKDQHWLIYTDVHNHFRQSPQTQMKYPELSASHYRILQSIWGSFRENHANYIMSLLD